MEPGGKAGRSLTNIPQPLHRADSEGRWPGREWPAPRWMQRPFLAGSSAGLEGFCP